MMDLLGDLLVNEGHVGLSVLDVREEDEETEGYRAVSVETTRGRIELRHYEAVGGPSGVLWLGGADGDWHTPAAGLYPRLCSELVRQGMSGCRVRFREPRSVEESVLDSLVGIRFLADGGCSRVGLVGHGFGATVALHVAALLPLASTVVTLSVQGAGAGIASDLAFGQSVLSVHGLEDEVLPPTGSRLVQRLAPGRKRLVMLPGARHGLDEAAEEVATLVRRWLVAELGGDGLGSIP